MSGYLQSVPPSSIRSFSYHVVLTNRSRAAFSFLSPVIFLVMKRIFLYCGVYWYEPTCRYSFHRVFFFFIRRQRLSWVTNKITTDMFELLVPVVLQSRTVDCHPAVGSRNRWTLSGSWARQANKPASGHCWLMQNLPLVLPHSSTVLLHWKLSPC